MLYEEKLLPVLLSDDELSERKARNAEIDLSINQAIEKLDEAKAVFKAETVLLKDEKKRTLLELKTGTMERYVRVMEHTNYEEALFEYVDEQGVLVHSRAMTLSERVQYRINFNSHHNS